MIVGLIVVITANLIVLSISTRHHQTSYAPGRLALSLVAPFQAAISRSREYLADSSGARFMGNNEALAGALEKLGAYSGRLPMNANPSTAHMFIVNPLSGKRMMGLFSTHPPLEDRIAKLRGNPPAKHVSDPNGDSRPDRGRDQGREFWDRLSGK